MRLIVIRTITLIYPALSNIFAAFAVVAFMLTLFSREIIHVFLGSSYRNAYIIVGFLTAALVCDGAFSIIGIGLNIRKKTYLNTVAFLIGTGCGIGCLVLLVPYYGIMGAAIPTLLGSVVSIGVEFYLAQRNYYINYEWKRVLSITLMRYHV